MSNQVSSESSQSLSGSILKQLIFLPWVQYPPFPRVPDLSDPAKFSFTSEDDNFDLTNISHLFISSPVGTTDSTSRIGNPNNLYLLNDFLK